MANVRSVTACRLFIQNLKELTLLFSERLFTGMDPQPKMKLLIDRFQPFTISNRLKGKKAVLAIPSEEGPKACEHVVGMFTLCFRYLQIDLAGTLLPAASQKGEVKSQPQTFNEAFLLGKSLK